VQILFGLEVYGRMENGRVEGFSKVFGKMELG